MRILIYSHYFAPSVGGVETYTMALAQGLVQTQAASDRTDVTVVTATAAADMDDTAFPFRVVRHPGVRKLAQLVKEADVIHVAGPAFLPMLIGLILSKPVVPAT